MEPIRIQTILAKLGLGSRRKCEQWIKDGEVTLNGKIVQLGDKADWPKDSIKVRGKRIIQNAEFTSETILFYKPRGVLSQFQDLSERNPRPTLSDYFKIKETRLFSVGRMDFNSEGLLLITNDGPLAERIQKVDHILKVYHVKVKGKIGPEMLSRLVIKPSYQEKVEAFLASKDLTHEQDAEITRHLPRNIPFLFHSVRVKEYLAQKTVLQIAWIGNKAFDLKLYLESRGFLVDKMMRFALGNLSVGMMLPGSSHLLRPSQTQALLNQPLLGLKNLQAGISPLDPEIKKTLGSVDVAKITAQAPSLEEGKRVRLKPSSIFPKKPTALRFNQKIQPKRKSIHS